MSDTTSDLAKLTPIVAYSQTDVTRYPEDICVNFEETESGVLSVLSDCRTGSSSEFDPVEGQEGSVGQGVGSVGQRYERVTTTAVLIGVIEAIQQATSISLDIETTGLDPRRDRVRLISMACSVADNIVRVILVDCFAVDPTPIWDALATTELILHNAAFDLSFLERLGFVPQAKVRDTMLLAQLLMAGTREKVSLGACCSRSLFDRRLGVAAQTFTNHQDPSN